MFHTHTHTHTHTHANISTPIIFFTHAKNPCQRLTQATHEPTHPHQGRSQNLKQVPQNFMKVFNVGDVTLTS